ncbi:MAG: class I SAM-dependent methyltransferase [Lamprobacter sp.]|uniref:class I SAM-dependent methyltransferase n=1 Tax=Lamprobacter sp. TaxID=3100796 RepID=UPI002B262849|nr:class I SAM-dependent methyltransferase [Lamprobacter sp.]MEA3639823.1 class I SAM-dependent methyltransferase [Lamprobacter sp.]
MPTYALWTQLLNIFLLISILVILVWVFYKIKKIHIASYKILNDASKARRESAAIFTQLQSLSGLEKMLDLSWPLPLMRGWAGSPDLLLTIADTVLSHKPTTVVECSSGVSTLVIARCLQINGAGHLYSLEHEDKYVQKTIQMLEKHNVENWASVLHSKLKKYESGELWYDDSVMPEDLESIEMLVVDGPPHNIAPLARLPAFERLLPKMAEKVIVILDDAAREAETEIVKQWLNIEPSFKSTYLNHEKGCVILERGHI